MARYTIESGEHGDQTFFAPDNGGYVRHKYGRNFGTAGRQICQGGGYRGRTLEANAETLRSVVRRWWRQRHGADDV